MVPYAYDSSTKVMSYYYSSVEPSDPQFAAALMSHYLFLFLVEADPNFATEAKAIMQDTNKLALVDVADVFDDGTSDWSLSMSGSNTVFNFAMLLIIKQQHLLILIIVMLPAGNCLIHHLYLCQKLL